MSISYIGVTEGPMQSGAISSQTQSVIVSSGSNRLLVVCTGFQSSIDRAVTSVVFNTSESFTHVRADTRTDVWLYRGEIWYLVNPTVTTANVVVTYAGATDSAGISFSAIQLNGVHQTTPVNTHNGSNGDSTVISVGVTTTVNGAMLIEAICAESDPAPTTSQTVVTERRPTSAFTIASAYFAQTSAGFKGLQWSQISGAWNSSVAAFAPAPTGQTLVVDSGVYAQTGIASIFRVASPTYLRYRK